MSLRIYIVTKMEMVFLKYKQTQMLFIKHKSSKNKNNKWALNGLVNMINE